MLEVIPFDPPRRPVKFSEAIGRFVKKWADEK
jgi:hypothetical protein